jgi:hypothetical protein
MTDDLGTHKIKKPRKKPKLPNWDWGAIAGICTMVFLFGIFIFGIIVTSNEDRHNTETRIKNAETRVLEACGRDEVRKFKLVNGDPNPDNIDEYSYEDKSREWAAKCLGKSDDPTS